MTKNKVVTEICSALEYLVDRDESGCITDVETHVRYTKNEVNSFIVRAGGKRFRVTAFQL